MSARIAAPLGKLIISGHLHRPMAGAKHQIFSPKETTPNCGEGGTSEMIGLPFPQGDRVRTQVIGGELKWRRNLYSQAQRKYNDIDDAWDLCAEFGYPLPNESDEVLDFYPTDEDVYDAPEVPSYAMDLMRSDYTSAFGDSFSDLVQESVPCMSLQDTSQLRYGLFSGPEYDTLSDQANARLSLKECRSILTEIEGDLIPGDIICLTEFVSCVLELQDYSTVQADMTVHGIFEKMLGHGWLKAGFLTRFKQDNVEEFIIGHKSSMPGCSSYLLTTADPITAMYCIRQQYHTPEDICRKLLKHGIPFWMSFKI
ncbi:hypothetical protein M422DRAFT_273014 [Sphaerobolus stellatus SS14]|uniref:Uncharacterized protein n=1 Tax=Sphaerobolus stellatus (strain SS14) TaxID=990650 RepID=A0A0C9UKL7_SPHS4|nr:hypothetical protein M422DRAFT_273014 [Sphaerobolus stellatus SS14]